MNRRMLLIPLFAIAAGCSGPALAEAEPTTVATPEPTVRPTPDPTPRATPIPTPTPEPGTPFMDFLGWSLDTGEDYIGGLDASALAAEAQDPAALIAADIDILATVNAALAWLEANPPQACYADVHAAITKQYRLQAQASEVSIDGWSRMDFATIDMAIDLSEQVNTAILDANALLDATVCS